MRVWTCGVLSLWLIVVAAGCGGGHSVVTQDICGNGLVEQGEVCDGNNLGGHSCASLNLGTGDLACNQDCTFDVSGCTVQADCGNGTVEGNEACDGADLYGTDCQDLGFDSGTLACTGSCEFDTSGCEVVAECGNGVQEGTEACDQNDLAGQSCSTLGLGGGTLGCNADCTYNTANCDVQPVCGNGTVEFGETCDGSDLAGGTCQTQGFYTGTLACGNDCNYDLSGCSGYCGDNTVNGSEVCDGTDLAGDNCANHGFYGGNLTCQSDCLAVDTSGCAGMCGDNTVNATEVCDGNDFGSETCQTQGFYTGTLACSNTCDALDTTGCSEYCGDGAINGSEVCDGDALGNASCQDVGMQHGEVSCASTCDAIDYSRCGNYTGVIITEVNLGAPDWVELYNISGGPIELQDWVLETHFMDNGAVSLQWVLPQYTLADGDRVLIVDNVDGTGGPPVVDTNAKEITYQENINWGANPGAAALYNPLNEPLDFVRWGGPDFAPPAPLTWADNPEPLPFINTGAVSLSRRPDDQDNDMAGDFCPADTSPTVANNACIQNIDPPGQLIITEIAEESPDRIELHNLGPGAVNLNGWLLLWIANTSQYLWYDYVYLPDHTVQSGEYVHIVDNSSGGPYVDANGVIHIPNMEWDPSRAGALRLQEPVLYHGIDFVRWGGSGYGPVAPDQWADTPNPAPHPNSGHSLGRRNLTDTNTAGDWCNQNPTFGAANSGCH